MTSLSLDYVYFSDEEEELEITPIQMNKLDALQLDHLRPQHIIQLLSLVESRPEGRCVRIVLDLQDQRPSGILTDRLADTFFPLVWSAPILCIEAVSRPSPEFSISGGHGSRSGLWVHEAIRTIGLAWFTQAAQRFPNPPPIRLLLQIEPQGRLGQNDARWLQLLGELPHVELTVLSQTLTRADIILLAQNFLSPRPPQRHLELRLNGNSMSMESMQDLIRTCSERHKEILEMGIVQDNETPATWGWDFDRYPKASDTWLVARRVSKIM